LVGVYHSVIWKNTRWNVKIKKKIRVSKFAICKNVQYWVLNLSY